MNNPGSGRTVSRKDEGSDSDRDDSGPSWWAVGLGVAAGIATLAGGAYMLKQHLEEKEKQPNARSIQDSCRYQSQNDSDESENEVSMNLTDAVSCQAVPSMPKVNSLNALLNDIHVRYIAIKKEDFFRRYNVLINVFGSLHKSMKVVDSYYNRYSSRCQFRPEEFSMNIIIGLPVNIYEDYRNPEESDIVIEPQVAGYLQLRAGKQYEKILVRDGPDFLINRQAYLWMDQRKYILRSKFISWFQSVVDRALNRFQRCVKIDGIEYKITTSCNGAAYTLWITNSAGFRLDVDLVPALKFPEERWLGRSKAYRGIPPNCNVDYWMVVPKPNDFAENSVDKDRSWHIDMYDQEKKLMFDSFHLRQGIRLMKKLRDAQQMKHIENYHIETLFLWESVETTQYFWQRDVATIFKVMLRKLLDALQGKKIRFFWKITHNLIERVPEDILQGYVNKLEQFSVVLENDSNYLLATKYLLTDSEYTEYKHLVE